MYVIRIIAVLIMKINVWRVMYLIVSACHLFWQTFMFVVNVVFVCICVSVLCVELFVWCILFRSFFLCVEENIE